jgi:hypothetical protein
MSYKLKSLLYFLAFLASSFIYYSMNEVSAKEIKVTTKTEMDSSHTIHTAANDGLMEDEALLIK